MATGTKLSVDEILEGICNLSGMEIAKLRKGVEEKFGVTAQAMAVAAPAAGGGAAAPAAEEKSDFTVFLAGIAAEKKITVIKVVREITGLGLKEAKELVEAAPKAVKEGVPKAQAEEMRKKLVEAGATIELK